jgi:hypothetical protein
MNIDYSLLKREEHPGTDLSGLPRWDIFISAFNQSGRVTELFSQVDASRKEWLVHPEYALDVGDLPVGESVSVLESRDEAEFWASAFIALAADSWPPESRICIDVTGFMRPHLMLFPRLLRDRGFDRLSVLYSDPLAYQSGEQTPFSQGAVTSVRQVRGFEGVHLPDGEDDLVVIGAGYDDELIRTVAEDKRAARKIEMFGLPSLQPHMYEENRLRAAKAEEAVGPMPSRGFIFAPANDPFATAQELHDRIREERAQGLANLYLSPLATKPQALGFALYYLCECVNEATSMLFPYAEYYSPETSVGLARVWHYELELDWLM